MRLPSQPIPSLDTALTVNDGEHRTRSGARLRRVVGATVGFSGWRRQNCVGAGETYIMRALREQCVKRAGISREPLGKAVD
jgi:hypothetical protein